MVEVVTLIATTYETDALNVMIPKETRRDVWARLDSVSRADFYRAGMAGLRPEIVAVTQLVNYEGETIAEIGGKRYAVYRTYHAAESDEIELYLEDRAGVRD